MNVERSLVLRTETRVAPIGTPITLRVDDGWDRPVVGATVGSGPTKQTRTDETGRCQLTFHAPGFWKIRAAKSPDEHTVYKPATLLVRTVHPSRLPQTV